MSPRPSQSPPDNPASSSSLTRDDSCASFDEPVGDGLTSGTLAFRQHGGGYTPAPNWPPFIAFAERVLGGSQPQGAGVLP
jgi:hypothetical protein